MNNIHFPKTHRFGRGVAGISSCLIGSSSERTATSFIGSQILAVICAALVTSCAHTSQTNPTPKSYVSDLEAELPEFAKLIWLMPASRDYNWFGFADGESELLEFKRVRAGHYDVVFLGDGEEDEVMLRSVEFWRTPDPNIVIMTVPSEADDPDNDESAPVAMLRSSNGSWVWCPELDYEGELISGTIDSYLNGVADRHGIKLHAGEQDQEEAVKSPTADQYLTLFSDADFLGGWKLARNNCLRLLPTAWSGFAEVAGRNTYSTGFFELQSEAFALQPEQLAMPGAFEGTFIDPDRGKVTITAQPDGSYLIDAEDPSWLFSSRSVKLLALDRPGTFLGISPERDFASEYPDGVHVDYFFLVEISDEGDAVLVKTAGRDYRRIIEVQNGYSERLQARVAAKRDLKIDDRGRIIGEIHVENIRKLFEDPGFLVTLETRRDHSLNLTRSEPNAEIE